MPDDRDFLSVDEAAGVLERSVPTMWRLIRQRSLETFRRPMDRRTYVRRADVEQLRSTYEPRVPKSSDE